MTKQDQTATAVISHLIREGQEANYERWLPEIIAMSKSYPGHLSVNVVRPVAGASVNYTIILNYDTEHNLAQWMGSAARKALIDKAKPYLEEDDRFEVKSGLDFWFTPQGAKAKLPTRWKQFLVTWSAIFPLVWIVSTALNQVSYLDAPAHRIIKVLLLTLIVVLLMVYVVMPRYTKLVHKWLFS